MVTPDDVVTARCMDSYRRGQRDGLLTFADACDVAGLDAIAIVARAVADDLQVES